MTVSRHQVERVALALLNDDRTRNGWPAADALSHLAEHDADAYRSSARAAIAALAQSPGDEVEAAAARLIDQSDEPSWLGGNYPARMNYWRDKAIEVANRLRAIVAINAGPSDGVTIPAGMRLVPQAWIDRAMQIEARADDLVSGINDAIQRAQEGRGRLYAANIAVLEDRIMGVLEAIAIDEPSFAAAPKAPPVAQTEGVEPA